MNTLAGLLDYVVSALQLSPICRDVRVVQTQQFSDVQFSLKVRADLKSGGVIQVRLYINGEHVDYAYQVVRDDRPYMRWDNKEHFSQIPTQPHHFHNPAGKVEESTLSGDPGHDLPAILSYLSKLTS